jgi:hypothetical protein
LIKGLTAPAARRRLATGGLDPRERKGVYGLPLGPHADELTLALLVQNHLRALAVLIRATREGWSLHDVEELIIAPAVSRVGELWLKGRLDDATFTQTGALAEQVERSFRQFLSRQIPQRADA